MKYVVSTKKNILYLHFPKKPSPSSTHAIEREWEKKGIFFSIIIIEKETLSSSLSLSRLDRSPSPASAAAPPARSSYRTRAEIFLFSSR